jgi:hypothetical protein
MLKRPLVALPKHKIMASSPRVGEVQVSPSSSHERDPISDGEEAGGEDDEPVEEMSHQSEDQAEAIVDPTEPEATHAQYAEMTATLASQFSAITAEMDRLRSTIDTDMGLGRIQDELSTLQSELANAEVANPRRRPGCPGRDPRRLERVAKLGDEMDDFDVSAGDDGRRGRVLVMSIALALVLLAGPLWPLITSPVVEGLASLTRRRPVPWYDQEID